MASKHNKKDDKVGLGNDCSVHSVNSYSRVPYFMPAYCYYCLCQRSECECVYVLIGTRMGLLDPYIPISFIQFIIADLCAY